MHQILLSSNSLYYCNSQWDKDHYVYNFDVSKGPVSITWFKGAQTNVCYNCLVSGFRFVAAGGL